MRQNELNLPRFESKDIERLTGLLILLKEALEGFHDVTWEFTDRGLFVGGLFPGENPIWFTSWRTARAGLEIGLRCLDIGLALPYDEDEDA